MQPPHPPPHFWGFFNSCSIHKLVVEVTAKSLQPVLKICRESLKPPRSQSISAANIPREQEFHWAGNKKMALSVEVQQPTVHSRQTEGAVAARTGEALRQTHDYTQSRSLKDD